MSASQGRAQSDELVALLRPVVEAAGADLEQVTVTPAGRRRLLRVVVDRDGGVDLDAVAELSRLVAAALDAPDADRVVGSGPYTLEVTSPGTDRPLTLPRHWRRAAGRLVRAQLADGSTLAGRVVEANDEQVELDVDGTRRAFPLADLGPGRIQVEFTRRAAAGNPEDVS